jgi:heme/copper-type cytochrome/quinol oxidase subunit 4
MKKTIILSLLFLFVLVSSHAQDTNQVEMADALRANGKIYIVAIVAAIVITILSVYVIMIDRKVTKLEEKINQK